VKRWIRRWQKISEMRVLAESFLFCSLLPSLFYLLPAWSAYFSGAFTRDYLVNPGRSVGAILSAPIVETAILFVPVLEICRKLKVPPVWTVLCFAAFFESLHTFRGFSGHLILYPTGVTLTVLYLAMRDRSFWHAFLFTAVIHELYNAFVSFANPLSYRFLIV
jgi:hypothetical protein